MYALSDAFVETSKDGGGFWRWEIKRRSQPRGVTLFQDGFLTPGEAQLAGESYLKQLLDYIDRETEA